MGQTGPQKASELGQRLREKLEADRSEIETLTRAQLERLSESMSDAVNSVANTIDLDTHRLKEAEAKRRAWSWFRPVVVGLSVVLGVSIGTASVTLYLAREITSQNETLDELSGAIALQRETLAELHDKTGGIDVFQSEGNWYVVIPENRKLTGGLIVGKRPAYKLSSD